MQPNIFLAEVSTPISYFVGGCSPCVEERSRFPMDYAYLVLKLSAERLIRTRADLPLCVMWNGYISVLSAFDSDQIWKRLTWIVTMFWSAHTLGFTTLPHLDLPGLYWCILHFFLNTPIPQSDHLDLLRGSNPARFGDQSAPARCFDTHVGFRHAQRSRPQRRTIMTTTANWVANGASLEDCHSNVFSLVQYQ